MNFSKTKLGGILLGLSVVLPGLGQGLQSGDYTNAIFGAIQGLGIILGTFGIRNAINNNVPNLPPLPPPPSPSP